MRWIGRQSFQQRILIANITAGDASTAYSITAGSGRVVTANGTTGNGATANLIANALANSLMPEFQEMTWTVSANSIVGTQVTSQAGKQTTFTSGCAGGAGVIGAIANTQIPLSAADVGNALNYSTGALPTNGDDLIFDSGAAFSALWNANALAAIQLSSLTIQSGYTGGGGLQSPGWIGLPAIDNDGSPYAQWRQQYLTISANNLLVGDFAGGQGPSLLKIDTTAANQSAVQVFSTGTSFDTNTPAFVWKGNAATFRIEGGSVGAAIYGCETALISALTLNDGEFLGGTGLTLTTATQAAGSMDTANAITTKTQNGGTHVHRAGNVTTLTLNSGTFQLQAAADLTIGTTTIGPDGVLDCTLCTGAVTLTNAPTVRPGGTIIDPNNRLQAGGTLTLIAQGGINSINLTRAAANGLACFT